MGYMHLGGGKISHSPLAFVAVLTTLELVLLCECVIPGGRPFSKVILPLQAFSVQSVEHLCSILLHFKLGTFVTLTTLALRSILIAVI